MNMTNDTKCDGEPMNKQSYMPQSKSDTHLTPDRVWLLIDFCWGLSKADFFDPCPANATFDGLAIPWKKLNYVNPPYTLLKEFVAKAVDEWRDNSNVTIMLLPAKTDQDWFHTKILHNGFEPKWINKRLKFKNHKHHATQPHFLVMIGDMEQ